jgi:hypothetical protein
MDQIITYLLSGRPECLRNISSGILASVYMEMLGYKEFKDYESELMNVIKFSIQNMGRPVAGNVISDINQKSQLNPSDSLAKLAGAFIWLGEKKRSQDDTFDKFPNKIVDYLLEEWITNFIMVYNRYNEGKLLIGPEDLLKKNPKDVTSEETISYKHALEYSDYEKNAEGLSENFEPILKNEYISDHPSFEKCLRSWKLFLEKNSFCDLGFDSDQFKAKFLESYFLERRAARYDLDSSTTPPSHTRKEKIELNHCIVDWCKNILKEDLAELTKRRNEFIKNYLLKNAEKILNTYNSDLSLEENHDICLNSLKSNVIDPFSDKEYS